MGRSLRGIEETASTSPVYAIMFMWRGQAWGRVARLVPLLKVLDSFWFPHLGWKGFKLVQNRP